MRHALKNNSVPSSAKQQPEITTFAVLTTTKAYNSNSLILCICLNDDHCGPVSVVHQHCGIKRWWDNRKIATTLEMTFSLALPSSLPNVPNDGDKNVTNLQSPPKNSNNNSSACFARAFFIFLFVSQPFSSNAPLGMNCLLVVMWTMWTLRDNLFFLSIAKPLIPIWFQDRMHPFCQPKKLK